MTTMDSSAWLSGIAASPGMALGRARGWVPIAPSDEIAAFTTPEREMARLVDAQRELAAQFRAMRDTLHGRVRSTHAEIFDVQIALLDDPELIELAHRAIRHERLPASAALAAASEIHVGELECSPDEQVRARAVDLRDVTRRLRRLLAGEATDPAMKGEEDIILVAHDLAPAETAQLDFRRVKGIITTAGSRTSHTAILARALGVPALVGVRDAVKCLTDGAMIMLDADRGRLWLHPTAEQIAQARQRKSAWPVSEANRTPPRRSAASVSPSLALMANAGGFDDVAAALSHGAEGIGLLRSECLCFERAAVPDEQGWHAFYRRVLDWVAPDPVIVRTLDLGGDKPLPELPLPTEANPFLGVRGLRLTLDRQELLRPQLRALLRAGIDRKLKIMLPFVTLPDEVRAVRGILAEEAAVLRAAGMPVMSHLELGMMLEVPAAMLMVHQFARDVDFFSIGTNDLVQYLFAADRTNPRVDRWQQPLHPIVLRLIDNAVRSAHECGKKITLCGELAAEIDAAPLWLGLGLDALSVAPVAIPRIRAALDAVDPSSVAKLVRDTLAAEGAEDVAALLRRAQDDAVDRSCAVSLG